MKGRLSNELQVTDEVRVRKASAAAVWGAVWHNVYWPMDRRLWFQVSGAISSWGRVHQEMRRRR